MNYVGKSMLTSIMYHEMVHVVQNNSKGTMPWYFIEGIADFTRLRLNFAAKHWKIQVGKNYDAGYDTTGFFLDYCDTLYPGLVSNLNDWAGEHEWDDGIFGQLCGNTIASLWNDYQASLSTGLPIISPTEYYFIDEVKDDLFYTICPEPLVFLQTCLEKTHEALFGNRIFTTRKLTFIVKSMGGVAHTQGSNGVKEIHLSIEYLRKFAKDKIKSDIEYEFHGQCLIIRVMYHEMVHVVQNNANGTMPWYFIEGIADFIRFRLNLGARHWKKQVGRNYDTGYETTGYFLDYCDNKVPGFVMRLNEWAGSHDWNDEIFEQMIGRSVKELWSEYQESIKH